MKEQSNLKVVGCWISFFFISSTRVEYKNECSSLIEKVVTVRVSLFPSLSAVLGTCGSGGIEGHAHLRGCGEAA